MVTRAIGRNTRAGRVCDGSQRIFFGEPLRSSLGAPARDGKERLIRRKFKPFWTTTRIIVSTIVVLVAVSGIAAGIYFDPARASTPSCANGAVNYASCDSCGSLATYNTSRQACFCTNRGTNPPSCNKFCANNAINPPSCDLCPDNRTDVFCPGQAPEGVYAETPAISWMHRLSP